MRQEVLSGILVLAMLAGLCACGDSGNPASSGKDAGSSDSGGECEQVVYAYNTFNDIPAGEALDTIEEAINKITREKINVEVTLKPISIADYSSNVGFAIQAGEKIDIFESLGDFNNYVNTDMAADITELIARYGQGAAEVVGEEWLQACGRDGAIYGIPTMKPIALTPMLVYRADIAQELGLDMTQVGGFEDVTDILGKVKEAYPDMTPLCPAKSGSSGVHLNYNEIDYLSDDFSKPFGVVLGSDLTVVDLYSTDEFKANCDLARTWYCEGLLMKDAATTTSEGVELMESGNYFAMIGLYSYSEEDTASVLESYCGYDLGVKILGDAYLGTSEINAVSWMISANCGVPEAAMKFLDLTYTNEEIINLLIYGIEGRDYVMDEEGYISYPEGQDASTIPYTAQLSCGTLGNFFLMHPMAGSDKASLEWELEQNQTAKRSPAMGFSFDSSRLKMQYAAVEHVVDQYLPGLMCGCVDPETEIPRFISSLNEAGYQDILAAKQEQLDAWAADKQI